MPFDYYDRLSRAEKATYRRSDGISEVRLADAAAFRAVLESLRTALEADERVAVAAAAKSFVASLLASLGVPPVKTQVLARRPSNDSAELHGLYTREEGKTPLLQVWMRTAAHENPVAFRTFVRTLLHEVCHHLDFELFALEDTFHTEGFFRRESSLVRQLLEKREGKKQLSLFPPD